ncbi:MAG: hypothetical protein LBI69_00555 [Puniceicoccales bacterium]|jgi:hypothetical protein|nr:hypothetical protein [Puniceicoccales bacterium]
MAMDGVGVGGTYNQFPAQMGVDNNSTENAGDGKGAKKSFLLKVLTGVAIAVASLTAFTLIATLTSLPTAALFFLGVVFATLTLLVNWLIFNEPKSKKEEISPNNQPPTSFQPTYPRPTYPQPTYPQPTYSQHAYFQPNQNIKYESKYVYVWLSDGSYRNVQAQVLRNQGSHQNPNQLQWAWVQKDALGKGSKEGWVQAYVSNEQQTATATKTPPKPGATYQSCKLEIQNLISSEFSEQFVENLSTTDECPHFNPQKRDGKCYVLHPGNPNDPNNRNVAYYTPNEMISFQNKHMPIKYYEESCKSYKIYGNRDSTSEENFTTTGMFCTSEKTSIVAESDKEKMRGCRDINRVGNAFITGSPVFCSEAYDNKQDNQQFTPFFNAIENGEVGLIVDLSSGDRPNRIYMHPNYAVKGGVQNGENRPKEEDFSDWEKVSYDGDKHVSLTKQGDDEISDASDTKIRNELKDNYISVKHRGKTLNYMKLDCTDGAGMDLETLGDYCSKIKIAAQGKLPLFHCNGGMGRSATMLCAYQLNCIYEKALEQNIEVTYDIDSQTSPQIDGKLNLAWAMRNLILNGRMARQVFVQSPDQFTCLATFAQFLANKQKQLTD